MEKRIPKPEPAEKPKTESDLAKAIAIHTENNSLALEFVSELRKQLASDRTTNNRAIELLTELVKPRPKKISVTVTTRDSEGRPLNYEIEVK